MSAAYTYDGANRLTQVIGNGDTTNYTYNANSALLSEITQGIKSTTFAYNEGGLLIGQTGLNTYGRTYFNDGNVATENNNEYSYDGMSRLSSENNTDFTFDIFSNRENKDNTSYTYDKNNRLLSDGSSSYSYDDNGNRLTKDNIEYTYDSFNRLVEVDGITYTYDGNGLMQTKDNTRFIWDEANIVAEITGNDIIAYSRGLRLISRDNGTTKEYYHFNPHGDVVNLTDSSGNITESYTYTAHGEVTSTDIPRFGYCGEFYDSDTGLLYLRARWYDSNIGAFINEDTHWNTSNMIYGDRVYDEGELKFPDIMAIRQSGNLYPYALNNPIRYVDSTGNNADVGVIAGMGGAVIISLPISWPVVAAGVAGGAVLGTVNYIYDKITAQKEPVSTKTNIGNLNGNDKKHILDPKHNWNKMVPDPKDPNNWGKITTIISFVLANGTEENYKGATDVFIKTCQIGQEVIQVTYKIIDDVVHISNAWVK